MVADLSKQVLIVDDDFEIVGILEELLGGLGHKVKTASSGSEALELANKIDYNFVFTDYNMPGIDKREYLKLLRSKLPASKIILMSGLSSEHFKQDKELLSLFNIFLDKPFHINEIIKILDESYD